jgi:hypothetical protein
MGLFGNNNSKVADTNKVNASGQYEDIESMPVAVAVPSSPKQNRNNMIVIHPNSKNSRIGGRRSLSPTPQIVPILFMSRTPILVPQCPICYKHNVRTRTTTYPDFMTWVTCAVLLFIFWPFFWIPLVLDSTRRTTHYCSACHNEIGSIRPFKDCCVKHRWTNEKNCITLLNTLYSKKRMKIQRWIVSHDGEYADTWSSFIMLLTS